MVEQLGVRDEEGDEILVDIAVNNGLLGLIRMNEPPRVTLSGAVSTRYEESGAFTIARLLRETANGGSVERSSSSKSAPEPIDGSGLIPDGTSLRLNGVKFAASPVGSGPVVELSALEGELKSDQQDLAIDLKTPTRIGEEAGSLAIRGRARGLLVSRATLGACALDLEVNGNALALPAAGSPLKIEELALTVKSDELAREARAQLRARITLPDGSPATIESEIEVLAPLDPARVSLKGKASVEGLPTTALAPYLPAVIVPQRDIGDRLQVMIEIDGRAARIDIASDHLAIHAEPALSVDGASLRVDALRVSGRVDPQLLPTASRLSSPIDFSLTGSVSRWPLVANPQEAAWVGAACDLSIALKSTSISLAVEADAVPTSPLEIGETQIAITSAALGNSAHVEVATRVNGAALTCEQSIEGMGRLEAEGIRALRARGRVGVEPIALASLPWLQRQVTEALAQSAIAAIGLEATIDGGATGGSANIALSFGGDSRLSTSIALTPEGFNTEGLHLSHELSPASLASVADEWIALSEPASVQVDIEPLHGTWESLSAGVPITGDVRARIAVPRLAISRASGVRKSITIESLAIDAQMRIDAEGAVGAMRGTLSGRALSGGVLCAKPTITLSVASPSFAQWTCEVDSSIDSAEALALCVDVAALEPFLAGSGTFRAKVDHNTDAETFEATLALPRLSLNTSGRLPRTDPGAPAKCELAVTSGSISIPADAIAKWMGLDADGASSARGAVDAAFMINRLDWRGTLEGSSLDASVSLKPGALELPARPRLEWGATSAKASTTNLAESASLAVHGSMGVGSAPALLDIAAQATGNLASVLSGGDDRLRIKGASGHVEAELDQLRALAAWWKGSGFVGASSTRLSQIKADLTIRSLALPHGNEAGTVDATIECAPLSIATEGRAPLTVGASRLGVKSTGLDRALQLDFQGDVTLGESRGESIAISADLNGDLRGLSDGATTPLVLSSSTLRVRAPGPLVTAAREWWRGESTPIDGGVTLGAIDATVRIDALRFAAGTLADASIKAGATLAPTRVTLAGRPPIQLGATSLTIEGAPLGTALSCTLATGGVEAGSVEVNAQGTGLRDASGSFAPLLGSWKASARGSRMRTALLDAFLDQHGALVEALGETLDVEVTAIPTPAADGSPGTGVSATVKTPTLTVNVPAARISGGVLAIAPSAPLEATFVVNKSLQRRLLEPINPVLSDIRTAPPVKATVSRCAYPLDGVLSRFDLDARIEIGDVEVVRSNQVIGILALAQESKDATVPARIEPLILSIDNGVLRYQEFIVKLGKFGNGWKQILKLGGEIDLTQSPAVARAITCRYPLASLGRTIAGASGPFQSTLRELSDQLQKLPIDIGMLVDVEVTLSGPLGDINGQARPLASKVRLAFDPSAIDAKTIDQGVKDVKQMIEGIRKLFGS